MFQGLLSLIVLVFALFAFDRLGIIDVEETPQTTTQDTVKASVVAPTTTEATAVRFTDRIVAKAKEAQGAKL